MYFIIVDQILIIKCYLLSDKEVTRRYTNFDVEYIYGFV